MSFHFRGLVAALLTPFDADGRPELELLGRHAAWLESRGIGGLCVGGACGELAGSAPTEFEAVCAAACGAAARVPVFAAIYPDSTSEAIELAEAAVRGGASAVLAAQPHYLFQPDGEGLAEMFRAVRRRVEVPVLLSNSVENALVSLEAVQRLAFEGLIDGVLQAGDAHLLADLLAASLPVPVFSGIEDLHYVALLLGAAGVVSSLAAVFPEDCAALYDAVQDGDHDRARACHERLLRLWRVLDDSAERLSRIKYACAAQSRPVGMARSPYELLRPASAAEIARTLQAEGKLPAISER
jgi:4-hydroxy-tetrahydrodipicolinate synthase